MDYYVFDASISSPAGRLKDEDLWYGSKAKTQYNMASYTSIKYIHLKESNNATVNQS